MFIDGVVLGRQNIVSQLDGCFSGITIFGSMDKFVFISLKWLSFLYKQGVT